MARGNPAAATALVDRLLGSLTILMTHPEAGEARPGVGRGIRGVLEPPYLIFYRVEAEGVLVIRILHGARRITRRLLKGG